MLMGKRGQQRSRAADAPLVSSSSPPMGTDDRLDSQQCVCVRVLNAKAANMAAPMLVHVGY